MKGEGGSTRSLSLINGAIESTAPSTKFAKLAKENVSSATIHGEIDLTREREENETREEKEREREGDRDYFARRKVRFTGFSSLTYRNPSGGINFI